MKSSTKKNYFNYCIRLHLNAQSKLTLHVEISSQNFIIKCQSLLETLALIVRKAASRDFDVKHYFSAMEKSLKGL